VSDVTSTLRNVARQQLATDGRCQQDMPSPDWCAHCICGLRPKPKESPLPPATVGKPVYANFPGRCRCRPGCLSAIDVDDLIVRVLDDDGWALLEHTADAS
jgi:hypothetical protein